MKRPLIILSFLSFLGAIVEANASLRVDLEDRKPEEVAQRSRLLAEQHPFANATVAIWVNETALATGIALDPYTVVTAAHTTQLLDAESIFVISSSNAQSLPKKCLYRQLANPEVIVHGPFTQNPRLDLAKQAILRDKETGALEMHGKLLTELEHTTLQDFLTPELHLTSSFFGIDLAIIKLIEPLPECVKYPEIMSTDSSINDTYGTIMGFGPLKYNHARGPRLVTNNLDAPRHLMSMKVSSLHASEPFTNVDLKLLYSTHKGLFVNGNESFIPDKTMMKTEGLPVGGDSGGPLFLKQDDQQKLVGIMSSTVTYNSYEMPDSPIKMEMSQIRQPIFNLWTDLRYYQDWIKEHMGPSKESI